MDLQLMTIEPTCLLWPTSTSLGKGIVELLRLRLLFKKGADNANYPSFSESPSGLSNQV